MFGMGTRIGLSLLLAGLFVVVAVMAAPKAVPRANELICGWSGGKWGSSMNICVTRQCYARRACGWWARPAARCNLLRRGASISEVYFQLGNPNRVDGARYEWFGKGNLNSSPDVAATMEGGKLIDLRCD